MNSEILKISSKSNPNAVAGAIAGVLAEKEKVEMQAVGAGAVMSYYGWIKHSNSYRVHQKYIRPYISMKECKNVLRNKNIQKLEDFK